MYVGTSMTPVRSGAGQRNPLASSVLRAMTSGRSGFGPRRNAWTVAPCLTTGNSRIRVMQLQRGHNQPKQNPCPTDTRNGSRLEFLRAGKIDAGGEFFIEMRVAQDQQRDQQGNEKA
jgi:hypothetical protein